MAREVPEIDRLIEQGLALYGQGNLDGALEVWERALAIDPDNPQANSYVEYVRSNYELLTADLDDAKTAEQPPFGIADDEPEYQIEIQPGEIKPAAPDPVAPQFLDPGDDGWYIEEETRDGINADSLPSQELTIAMSADEPPQDTLTVTKRRASSASGIDFDDATREYDKQRPREASEGTGFTPTPTPPRPGTANSGSTDSGEFPPEGTPAFGHPNDFQTPPGFGTQTTGIKRRELGFVHPTGAMVAAAEAPKPPATTTDLGLTDRPRAPAAPTRPPPVSKPSAAADDDEPEISIERNEANEPVSPDGPTVRKQLSEIDLDDDDLIKSLPSPRPAPQVKQITIDTPLSGSTKPTTGVATRDFPNETRAPAFAKTREMPAEEVAIGKADTQDFEGTTQARGRTAQVLAEAQDIGTMQDLATISIGAPTQDLGLRELAASALGDVHRAETTGGEGTRADVVLPFDPIDARSTEILAEIDRDAPRDEAQEDRTRRRITALFERSAQWTSSGELERAVAAVDLALAEDPNAALAQKLIHRNRDTIMTVFQTYLGDLDRAPQLARPLHELGSAPISPRAAFLLSRIDGLLTIDEILDVCGMPRLEAYRYLCQLFLRGILR